MKGNHGKGKKKNLYLLLELENRIRKKKKENIQKKTVLINRKHRENIFSKK